jgi:S-(hydroxymethyl)glutathione dehydrogenase/alcohol dehydrogenase
MCKSTFGGWTKPFDLDGVGHHNFANVSSFSEYTVVKANQAVPIPREIPLASASLIGCGVLTGAGAVLNRAKVAPGESAVVIGVGGIGLNAIQALALSGAWPIIAVDTNPRKADIARTFGATHVVNPTEADTVTAVRDLTGGGADYVFECVGAKALMEQAIELLDWNGTFVILGVTPFGTKVEFAPEQLYHDKTIMGCRYGSSKPQRDIRRYAELYLAGRFKLDELVTRVYPMDAIDEVLHDMHEGALARGVLDVCPLDG